MTTTTILVTDPTTATESTVAAVPRAQDSSASSATARVPWRRPCGSCLWMRGLATSPGGYPGYCTRPGRRMRCPPSTCGTSPRGVGFTRRGALSSGMMRGAGGSSCSTSPSLWRSMTTCRALNAQTLPASQSSTCSVGFMRTSTSRPRAPWTVCCARPSGSGPASSWGRRTLSTPSSWSSALSGSSATRSWRVPRGTRSGCRLSGRSSRMCGAERIRCNVRGPGSWTG
mmetsp:Transcript_75479/g.233008  ORF Transcript_75479/g.233008 Transcript_75479/m.233008 type:complete len:228 (+) Transcript_75479:594-1277(+)